MKLKTKINVSLSGFLIIGFCYVFLLMHPKSLFSFHYDYQNFSVYSDQEIPKEIEAILSIVKGKILKSELYQSSYQFNIYICHNENKFAFFTRSRNSGGVVQGIISPNVFIREANIVENKIVPPGGWLYDANERPLSYFIAHELIHSLQAYHDRFLILKVPAYILEGYADYIAKDSFFDFAEYRQMLLDDHWKMRDSSPLYHKYHLYTAYLMEQKNWSYKDILQKKPDIETIMEEIKLENN